MKKLLVFTFLFSTLFNQGCSHLKDKFQSNVDFELVASEKHLPANFHEVAYRREQVPHFNYLTKMAKTKEEFNEIWKLYQLSEKKPNVNLDKNNIFFVGVEESSSCPYELGAVNQDSSKEELTIHLSEPDGACTSDATPRTFVIEIKKEITDEIKSVVIVQGDVETPIPIEGSLD